MVTIIGPRNAPRRAGGGGGGGESEGSAPSRTAAHTFLSSPGAAMDQYRRIETPKEQEPIDDHEIRVMHQGKVRRYISYATNILTVRGPTARRIRIFAGARCEVEGRR